MSELNKECHANNNDILSNCLKIINVGAVNQVKHRASSHGNAYLVNRNRVEDKNMAGISAPIDSTAYFDDLLQGEH